MDDFGSKFNVAAKFVFNVIKLQKAFLNYARPTGRHDKQAVVSVDSLSSTRLYETVECLLYFC